MRRVWRLPPAELLSEAAAGGPDSVAHFEIPLISWSSAAAAAAAAERIGCPSTSGVRRVTATCLTARTAPEGLAVGGAREEEGEEFVVISQTANESISGFFFILDDWSGSISRPSAAEAPVAAVGLKRGGTKLMVKDLLD